jgi:phenylacetate-coenzyme A ligase PaaK-like adenylate-forming protein
MMFDELIETPAFSLNAAEKQSALLPGLNELIRHHYDHSLAYRRIADAAWGGPTEAASIAEVPYLPVSLFKELELSSTETPSMVLQSSGTTGQVPSRIVIDAETADRQARALVATFRPVLGASRMPLLLIDTRKVITDPAMLTARGAGVLGMMKFGARATFALDEGLETQTQVVRDFVAKFGGQPFFLFGFTFLVWTHLYQAFADGELDLSNAVLIHSGGWKKMEAEKVGNDEFRAALARRFNLTQVYNFYGFVEQIGSIFLEGEPGLLYPPNFTDVIIRDPATWEPLPPGEPGVVQVVSLLPRSYPGHSVLTEDLGVLELDEARSNGRRGAAIRILGRVPRSEIRGCSDVIPG